MSEPKRIQRKRTKGWRMPEGAVYVGRPSAWGNPFPLDGDWATWAAVGLGYRADKAGRRRAAVALHRSWLTGSDPSGPLAGVPSPISTEIHFSDGTRMPMAEHARQIALVGTALFPAPQLPPRPEWFGDLEGRDLACWCPLDAPCHADVLLEIANARFEPVSVLGAPPDSQETPE